MTTQPRERKQIVYVCDGTEKDMYDVLINCELFTSRNDAKAHYNGSQLIPEGITSLIIGKKKNDIIVISGYKLANVI
jgi:hypothetical protein